MAKAFFKRKLLKEKLAKKEENACSNSLMGSFVCVTLFSPHNLTIFSNLYMENWDLQNWAAYPKLYIIVNKWQKECCMKGKKVNKRQNGDLKPDLSGFTPPLWCLKQYLRATATKNKFLNTILVFSKSLYRKHTFRNFLWHEVETDDNSLFSILRCHPL